MTGASETGGMDLLGALAAGRIPATPGVGPTSPPAGTSGADDALGGGAPGPAGAPPCSRRGCTVAGVWAMEWNNPRVHTPERVKTWLACAEHRAHLEDFLDSRGFLRRVRPLHSPAPAPAAASTPDDDEVTP